MFFNEFKKRLYSSKNLSPKNKLTPKFALDMYVYKKINFAMWFSLKSRVHE